MAGVDTFPDLCWCPLYLSWDLVLLLFEFFVRFYSAESIVAKDAIAHIG